MSNKSRFYFAKAELPELGRELRQRGYDQLPDCTRDNSPGLDKMIIDTHRQNFWVLDNPVFENSATTIRNTFDTDLVELDEPTLETL